MRPALLCGLLSTCLFGLPALAATVDVVGAPTGFFAPGEREANFRPYYRWHGEDWSWTHGAIGESFTTATLNISAYDVDSHFDERDEIFAYDDGSPVSLGYLTGLDLDFAYTTFALGPSFHDDIARGLRVSITLDIQDVERGSALAKSVIATDGAALPSALPVPLPAGLPLLLGGIGAAVLTLRHRRSAS